MNNADAKVLSGSYGWVIVLVTFVLTALFFGGFGLVSVFIKPLAQDFGWQRGDVAAAYTIAVVSTAVFGVAFGRLSDLRGVTMVTAVGALAMAASLLLLSQITALWQLYALYALFGGLGHGAITVPLTAAVTHWFSVNRGLAVGIAMAGSAIGLGVIPFIASTIIADSEWRDAWLYLGLCYLAVGSPLVLLVRNPPKEGASEIMTPSKQQQEGAGPIAPREALVWVSSAVVFCCICMAIPMIHLPSLASDLGLSMERAASVLTVVMLSGAIGRLIFGRIADSASPLTAYILSSLGQTAFVFWFVQAPSLTSLYPIAVGYGLCFGGVMTGFLLTIRSLVSAKMAGTAMAITSLFGWIGMGVGGYLGGLFFDWSGTYVASFAVAAAAGTVNIAILMSLHLRLRRAGRLQIGSPQAQRA